MLNNVQIYVMSRRDAIATLKGNLGGHPTIVVSISSPDDDSPVFINKDLVDAVYTKFNDVEDDKYLPSATHDDVKEIRPFIDKYKENLDSIDYLIVHCDAGISRSAAVAASICEYLGKEHRIFFDERYAPNYHVYKLMCQEFEIDKTQEYYEDIFGKHEQYMRENYSEEIEF